MALLSAFLASASFGTVRDFLESPVRTHPSGLPTTTPHDDEPPVRVGSGVRGSGTSHQPATASTLAVNAFSMAPASAETTKGLVR